MRVTAFPKTPVQGATSTRPKYTWDGWDCVKEDDGTNVIRYYCPQGELFSIERNATFYQVHTDALGSVRALTDSTGAVAASYTYGAWGETLSASHPSGWTLSTLFVGGLGLRFDPTTGLHYMRNRWYDAGLGRFISRDALMSRNRYEYAFNNPLTWVDTNGLQPHLPPGWHYAIEDGVPSYWDEFSRPPKPKPPKPTPKPPVKDDQKPCPDWDGYWPDLHHDWLDWMPDYPIYPDDHGPPRPPHPPPQPPGPPRRPVDPYKDLNEYHPEYIKRRRLYRNIKRHQWLYVGGPVVGGIGTQMTKSPMPFVFGLGFDILLFTSDYWDAYIVPEYQPDKY